MKKAIRLFYQSFYSRALYHDAAHAWQGTGIGVLASVLLIAYLAFMPLSLWKIAGIIDYKTTKNYIVEQIPTVTIENGNLSIDQPVPYYITTPENRIIATIDTRPETSAKNPDAIIAMMQEDKSWFFIGEKFAISMDEDGVGEVDHYQKWFTEKEKVQFNKNDIADYIKKAEILGIPLLAVLLYCILLLYAIIQMMLYSLGALALNKIAKAQLNYAALQRITVCALTPAEFYF